MVHERVIKAETVTTNVTVGNTAPTFTAGPAENPVSSATTPTNVGSDVTFEATANDANGENYYLAICKTDAVTAVNGGAPTCDGGAWCVSSATASDAEATCSYTALQGDVESNDWYAFVCDGSAAAACSTSSQGSGDSGSPFKVNHAPIFNTISNDAPQDPGSAVTWSTNISTDDPDTDTTADTVKLLVCATEGITGDACNGTELCNSGFVASNPSCSYTPPVPTADNTYNAYVYLVDNHNFPNRC